MRLLFFTQALFFAQALSQVDAKKVAERAKNHDEGPLKLISNQRQRHVPWSTVKSSRFSICFYFLFMAYFQLQAVCTFKEDTVEHKGFTNLSQSIERMGMTTHVPCITPRGEFYHMREERYLTGQGAQKKH